MALSVFILCFFQWGWVSEIWTITVGLFIHDWVSRMTCGQYPVSWKICPSVWHYLGKGVPPNLSHKLRRRFLNVWIPFEGSKPPQEQVYSTWNFLIIYCHMLLWLEAGTIGSLAGFELQTLGSAATYSTLWATSALVCTCNYVISKHSGCWMRIEFSISLKT